MRVSLIVLATLVISLAACAPAGLEPYDTCVSEEEDGDIPPPGLAAELLVPDVDSGVEWYRDVAGFTLLHNAAAEKSCFAALDLEGGQVLLSHVAREFDAPENSIELRFMVADVDAVYARIRETDDVVLVRDILDEEYGLRDFVVRDVYGFRVRFATPL